MSIFLQYCGQLRIPMVRVSFTKLNNNFWVHLLSTRKLYFSINEILTHPKWNAFWQIILELKRNHNIMKNPLLSRNRCKYGKKTTHRSHNWWNWSASNSVHYLVVFFFVCIKKERVTEWIWKQCFPSHWKYCIDRNWFTKSHEYSSVYSHFSSICH